MARATRSMTPATQSTAAFSQLMTAVAASFKAARLFAAASFHFISSANHSIAVAAHWITGAAESVLTSARAAKAFGGSAASAAAPLDLNRQRVAAPAVRAKGFAVIGKRVAEADWDDIEQSAYVRLLMMPSLRASLLPILHASQLPAITNLGGRVQLRRYPVPERREAGASVQHERPPCCVRAWPNAKPMFTRPRVVGKFEIGVRKLRLGARR